MSEILVETFECQETAAEPIEACEEATALIEELGLEGQKKLVVRDSKSGRDSRCPYRMMTADEVFVYGTLCPQRTRLQRYNATTIPLRVLQIAAHANSLGLFKSLEVWDREAVAEKDPVLVAYDGEDWSSNTKRYILARWGTELETFVVLMKRAVAQARDGLVQQAESALAAVKAASDVELIRKGPTSKVQWE